MSKSSTPKRCVLAAMIAGILVSASSGYAGAPDNSARPHARGVNAAQSGEMLPTGMRITPTAAPGAVFEHLNPDLADNPDYLADHAVSTAISPNGATMLVLTSGYNRNNGADGSRIAEQSNEYVFVYDISQGRPQKTQVLQVANTFNGIAWNAEGSEFYVSGGVDDSVHIYANLGGVWQATGEIALGHAAGEGLRVGPMAAGVAVNASGTQLLAANFENDSVSLVDLETRTVLAEQDLRPGKIDPALSGTPGGTYPFAVAFKGDDIAYVSSQRDREIDVIKVGDGALSVIARIKVQGQPNKMILNRAQNRLYVASDNADTVVVIDTASNQVVENIAVLAPRAVFPHPETFKGANPNNLALSPDQGTLFVSNGGANSVAVVQLAQAAAANDDQEQGERDEDDREDRRDTESRVIGLIPTGWYPNAVSVSADGTMLYVVNGKSNAGPNPQGCRDTVSIEPGALDECRAANQYVWQLEKAGLLSLPMPSARQLAAMTWQVAYNNRFPVAQDHQKWKSTMAFLRQRIQHVIYVVKENRTYDQVLGDLERGNGDPSLAILGPYSPNHQQLARQFVTLDNFYDSGETSNTGWNWTTAARSTDFTEKTAPVNYAGRGLTYDWEGNNRNINVGHATVAERQAANPYSPGDPDILAGTADVAAPDSPEGEAGAGYLWDAALNAGLSVRNYGFYGDLSRYFLPASDPAFIALSPTPHADNSVQFFPTKQSLMEVSDPYFRGYDQKYADYWRFKEWEREFDQYAAREELPNLSLVRIPHDHFGSYSSAMDGVGTVETQMADNDYALGLIVEKVANSPFKDNTLIFVLEDDAQNGGDHVDPHRSIGYIVGPYVKQDALISKHYTTVSMLRTLEEVLGIEPMGINDGLAAPMAELFDIRQKSWDYTALVPEVLYSTSLPLPPRSEAQVASSATAVDCDSQSRHTPAYWQQAMAGQDFTAEDKLDTPKFNQALWAGLKGKEVPAPTVRHGDDLRRQRQQLIAKVRAEREKACSVRLTQR